MACCRHGRAHRPKPIPPQRSLPSRSLSARRNSSIDRAVRDLITAAREAGPGGDVHDLDASELGPGELDSLTSPSLFGGGCVVVIRAAQNASKDVAAELARYAKNPAPDVVLVLTHAGGAKGKELLAGGQGRRSPGDRMPEGHQVRRAARLHQGRVPPGGPAGRRRRRPRAAGRGGFGPAGARGRLRAARRRHEGRASVDEAVVARYYRGRAEATGFTVADRAVEGHLAQALEQLRWALATGVSPVLICSALAQGVRLLGRVGSAPRGASSAALAAEVGAPPWKIDRVRQQLRGWHPTASPARCTRSPKRTRKSRARRPARPTRWSERCAGSSPAGPAATQAERQPRAPVKWTPALAGDALPPCPTSLVP